MFSKDPYDIIDDEISRLEKEKRKIDFDIFGFGASQQEKDAGKARIAQINSEISALNLKKVDLQTNQNNNDNLLKGMAIGAGGLGLAGLAAKLFKDDKKSNKETAVQPKAQSVATCECGATLKADDKFCKKCGKAVEKSSDAETVFCTACGTKNDKENKFCKECGNKLK